MINWIIGASGGGKSYEAVRYHIVPALEKGRHVITNLPLNIEEFIKLSPDYEALLHIRKQSLPILGKFHLAENNTPIFDLYTDGGKDQPPRGQRLFAGVWDYYFDESYRTKEGKGPLFVIDECHFSLPYKNTSIEVEDWFSVHRHYNSDVLLLTQSYGKCSQNIRDNTQIVYRVRKNIAFGSKNSYVKKVQDGFRGDVVNTSIRQYDPKYFPLYKSHTQGQSVEEYGAEDITPLWMRWPFIGTGICALIFVFMLFTVDFQNPFGVPQKSDVADTTTRTPTTLEKAKNRELYLASLNQPVDGVVQIPDGVVQMPDGVLDQPPDLLPEHPLKGKNLHIIAHVQGIIDGQQKEVWMFTVSQNAQKSFDLDLNDLMNMGYSFFPFSDCVASITYGDFQQTIMCDAPTHKVTVGGTQT